MSKVVRCMDLACRKFHFPGRVFMPRGKYYRYAIEKSDGYYRHPIPEDNLTSAAGYIHHDSETETETETDSDEDIATESGFDADTESQSETESEPQYYQLKEISEEERKTINNDINELELTPSNPIKSDVWMGGNWHEDELKKQFKKIIYESM